MAATPHHPFVVAWADEYAKVGQYESPHAYCMALQQQGVNLQTGLRADYHALYHAAQAVMQQQPSRTEGLVLQNAALSYMRLQLCSRWDWA